MAKIIYENLKMKVCIYCNTGYKPTGPAQFYCTSCKKKLDNLTQQVSRDIARFKKFGTYDFLGKGGSNLKGKEDSQYKTGESYFQKTRTKVKEEVRYCEDCGKDLKNVSRYLWCVHHVDFNRSNNVRENYRLLCKRCHQLTHNCEKNLPQNQVESATTISEESTPK